MLNIQGKDRKILKKRKRERKEKKRLEAAVKQQKESSGKRRIQINLNCNMVRGKCPFYLTLSRIPQARKGNDHEFVSIREAASAPIIEASHQARVNRIVPEETPPQGSTQTKIPSLTCLSGLN